MKKEMAQMKKYQKKFEKTKKYLPKEFIDFYDEYGLHDSIIKNINITKLKKDNSESEFVISIDFVTYGTHVPFRITYREVLDFDINWNTKSYCEFGDYVSGELLHLKKKKNLLSHEFIMYSIPNRFYVKFKRLEFSLL